MQNAQKSVWALYQDVWSKISIYYPYIFMGGLKTLHTAAQSTLKI